MPSMACHYTSYASFSSSCSSPNRDFYFIASNCSTSRFRSSKGFTFTPLLLSSVTTSSSSSSTYNTLVFQATNLLGPPARFEASKLTVVLREQEVNKYKGIVPRTYTLSHCDFTANLTLTISNVIQLEQLKGWYNKDDVVAEWKEVKGKMCLDVHCYVSGPNLFLDLAAAFRYHIFSKELPLVLKAVLYGDSLLFEEHQELMDAYVRVYFHSSSTMYNRVECWGPLKDAAQGIRPHQATGLFTEKEDPRPPKFWGGFFQALVAFLL